MRINRIIIFLAGLTWTSKVAGQENSVFGVYQHQDKFGHSSELNLYSDSTFLRIDQSGNIVINNKGVFELIEDTIFFTYKHPSISNAIDTFTNEGHFLFRKDTFWLVGDNELSEGYYLFSSRYYRTEAWNEKGQITAKKEWELFDTVYVDEGNLKHYIPNRQRPHGNWVYFDFQGNRLNEDLFVHGQKELRPKTN